MWGIQITYTNLEQTEEGVEGKNQCEDVATSHKE
jgi:hypothetical protein